MNLQETMSDMLHRDLTIEEARVLADEQFGMLATYLREQYEAISTLSSTVAIAQD